ncbi:MAG: mechanosensitive ion channel family protein [Pseudomonadota bacterium]
MDRGSDRSARRKLRLWLACPGVIGAGLVALMIAVAPPPAIAQRPQPAAPPAETNPESATEPAEKVDVKPGAGDVEIADRLRRIMSATGWFDDLKVDVRDGIVFLDGLAETKDQITWAGNLARKTEDVVAVVNRLNVNVSSAWDFAPAFSQINRLTREALQAIPLVIFGVIILVIAWLLSGFASRALQAPFARKFQSPLLARIAANAVAIPIFLIGLYIVLRISGLTQLALTVVGGTGLLGVALGFAFRDIAENFFASVLLSVRQPFSRDDLVEITGHTGVVRQLNTRSTLLMTLDGNHVQIPTATVYKSPIVNCTSSPTRRDEFTVGIGYDDAVSHAQRVMLEVLRNHPAVVDDPEPMVLVDRLGASTIDLRVFYWYDGATYAPLKIKSALMRLAKRELLAAGISMPDEAREVIFPNGVPVLMQDGAEKLNGAARAGGGRDAVAANAVGADKNNRAEVAGRARGSHAAEAESYEVATDAEGGLESEQITLKEQADHARNPEGNEDLLSGDAPAS